MLVTVSRLLFTNSAHFNAVMSISCARPARDAVNIKPSVTIITVLANIAAPNLLVALWRRPHSGRNYSLYINFLLQRTIYSTEICRASLILPQAFRRSPARPCADPKRHSSRLPDNPASRPGHRPRLERNRRAPGPDDRAWPGLQRPRPACAAPRKGRTPQSLPWKSARLPGPPGCSYRGPPRSTRTARAPAPG